MKNLKIRKVVRIILAIIITFLFMVIISDAPDNITINYFSFIGTKILCMAIIYACFLGIKKLK